jgi:hypothetical protein
VSQNPIRKGRAKAALPSSRCICPRPPLRSFTKEMGGEETAFLMLPGKRLRQRALRCGAPPCDPPTQLSPPATASGRRTFSRFLRSQLRRIGLGIRSGRDPKRTSVEHGTKHSCPNQIATEASAPDAEASVSTSLPTRSLPKEDLGIPRRPVDRRCGAKSAPAILDVPAWGATPRRSVSDYDKEEKHHALGYFLT